MHHELYQRDDVDGMRSPQNPLVGVISQSFKK